MIKRSILFIASLLLCVAGQAQEPATVYFTTDITPESLLKIYKALGVEAKGNVAVKISTGESAQTNYLRPEFIAPLINEVSGTIVECNTAYPGNRNTTEKHLKAIAERGFDKVAKVDIMDAEGSMELPMQDTTYFAYNLVGKHLNNYDFMINLAHFKGHQMGGFGGVLKNQSIGVASSEGKTRIHTVGKVSDPGKLWSNLPEQDHFLEAMAGAAQSVDTYFKKKNGIVYINVMNNMSVDCDCNGHPEPAKLKDMGILASLDPVALDQACLELVFNHASTAGDDSTPLIERINRQHGTHIVDYAEQLGLGSKKYKIVKID